jgi:O-antigen/teichoic acid export membrane protein
MNTMKRDYFWNTLGVFIQNAISPLLLIVVTRVNGIDDSGVFSFAFSVAVVFWAIAMWGGRTYQVSDVSNKFMRQSYVLMRLLLSFTVLILALLFCLANGYNYEKTAILMSLVVVRVLEGLSDVYYGVMQSEDKLYVSGKIMFVKYILAFLVFAAVDFFTQNVLLSTAYFVAVMGIFLLFIDVPMAKRIDPSITAKLFTRNLTKQALSIIKILTPVFVVSFFAMLALNIPRYFVDLHHESEIGYFGILVMPVTLIVLMMTLILQPNVMQLSRLLKQKDIRLFNKQVFKICGVTLSAGVLILGRTAIIGVPALEIVFGIDFQKYYIILVFVVVAAIINALVSVLMNILVIMRVFQPQVFVLVLTNISLLVASALLIPEGGVITAVVLFMAVNLIQLVLLGIIYGKAISREK